MRNLLKTFLYLGACSALASPTLLQAQQDPGEPCCGIISVAGDVVTVKHHKTGATFQVKVTKAEPASVLQVGRSVSFTAGSNTLFVHTRAGAAPRQVAVTPVKLNEKASGATPCCTVVAIDVAKGIVTARELATGYTFRFKAVKGALPAVKIGDAVAADFAAKSVRLKTADGSPCCAIIN